MTNRLSGTSVAVVILSIVAIAILTSAHSASAHASYKWMQVAGKPENSFQVTIGELNEPVYVDSSTPALVQGSGNDHDTGMDFILTDRVTGLPITNAFKAQTSSASANLWVDEYFYPKSFDSFNKPLVVLTAGGNNATASDIQVQANVKARPGYTDSHIHVPIKAVANQPGHFTGDVLEYTMAGRTLYHVYGYINYYNDSMVSIDLWNSGNGDGLLAGGKTIDNSLGLGHVVNATNGTIVGGGSTTAVGPGSQTSYGSLGTRQFGMTDRTTLYWPGASAGINNSTHPASIPAAVGKGGDLWSFLNNIATAINSITGGATVTQANPP
ncbi:MAG TPA: hypothetical protein VLT10_00185 [Verrucomicrobiae bacterium]|nr:hypothetical protein [Verrucomicrobiae bacterium]